MKKENPREILIKELIKTGVENQEDLNQFKRKMAKKYKIPCPSNFSLLKTYHRLLENKRIKNSKTLENLLKIRPVRSLSGIVNVTVLTKPYPCPGRCIFCPIENGIPKSYLSGEPAVERAKKLKFDPYLQVKKRIEMLKLEGHPTDKIELRIVGGTWSYYPKNYQNYFIKRCFEAANEKDSKNLKEAQKKNEGVKNRIVGISIETRPDFIDEKEILRLRNFGATMVEMGVQTIFDDILEKNKTGLNQEKIARATKLLKDSGFKVLYHLMLNLPGSNPERDRECFKIIFSDERFKPDWIKIYPVVVTKGSQLYQIWKRGNYKPYSEKELIDLLIKIKKDLPCWVRVARILRDIPAPKIIAGYKTLNLREVAKEEMKRKNLVCNCIRCREIRGRYNPKEKIYLFRQDYQASGGREIFLSYENKNQTKLYSLLRLRIPNQFETTTHPTHPPTVGGPHSSRTIFRILKNAALIREIQTYGELVPISEIKIAPQHRGLGKKLIKKAEEIAKREYGLKKIAVISGIGVRNYYRKLKYRLKDTYMIKRI